jgi:hypothetical protein
MYHENMGNKRIKNAIETYLGALFGLLANMHLSYL